MAKENKDCYVRVRITKSEQKQIEAYCDKYKLSVSDFVRLAMENQLRKGD